MSLKLYSVNVEPGDNFEIRYKGSEENAIAVSIWEKGKMMVSGPINPNMKRFFFCKEGVEEISI